MSKEQVQRESRDSVPYYDDSVLRSVDNGSVNGLGRESLPRLQRNVIVTSHDFVYPRLFTLRYSIARMEYRENYNYIEQPIGSFA